ncbi:spore germination protein [Cohnella sp. GCM10027633]|uniref:spore germination protein n=1 Tax=unclassified Cohnella TaxID=2636738 RepID=UPI00362D5A76
MTVNGKAEWTEERLRVLFEGSSDVVVQTRDFGPDAESRIVLAYSIGLSDGKTLSQVVLPELGKQFERSGAFREEELRAMGSLLLGAFPERPHPDAIAEAVFEGELVLLFAAFGGLYRVSIDDRPRRMPFESNTEISIKGAKDGFIEDIVVNAALIRKRARSTKLRYEPFTLGERTRTKVGLLYYEDLVSEKPLRLARERLAAIDAKGIFSSNQIEEALSDSRYAIMPLVAFTGRPDFAVQALLAGRFVVLVDGNPMALIGPADLTLVMKSPEDAHFNYAYISFARIIRLISLFISVFLPGIWVALMAFHQDQIPFRLMATISVSRLGLPLSAQMEMFILLMLLEIFREAGVRLPNPIGQTLTSIGGLIIGDAAIRAGLVSPSVVVVGAITAVCGVTLVNQMLSTTTSVLRMFFFFIGSFLGMYGMILGMILLVVYMSRLRSFGVPYLPALSPPRLQDALKSVLSLPWKFMDKRPRFLTGEDDAGDSGKEGNR